MMLEEFYELGDGCVIVSGKPLRLCTRKMRLILKAWASFTVQKLELASNQYEFIVKLCMALMEILNHEPIDVGILIADNIKYIFDAPQ